MRKYENQAQEILESDAQFHDRVCGGVYSVRVHGEFLCDEDTYALKRKVEKVLRRRERTGS